MFRSMKRLKALEKVAFGAKISDSYQTNDDGETNGERLGKGNQA